MVYIIMIADMELHPKKRQGRTLNPLVTDLQTFLALLPSSLDISF